MKNDYIDNTLEKIYKITESIDSIQIPKDEEDEDKLKTNETTSIASGGDGGGYMTKNFLSAGKSGKEKMRKNAENSGFTIVDTQYTDEIANTLLEDSKDFLR